MQERAYIVQTPVRDTSRCDQRLEAAPRWHMGKTSSTKQLVSRESGYVQAWKEMISLWTSAKRKPVLYRANTLHNRLFSEPLTVYQAKHVLHHFRCRYLKANKVSKSDDKDCWTCILFFKYGDTVCQKLSKLVHAFQNYSWHVCFDMQCAVFCSVAWWRSSGVKSTLITCWVKKSVKKDDRSWPVAWWWFIITQKVCVVQTKMNAYITHTVI